MGSVTSATTPGQKRPGNNGNKRVLNTSQKRPFFLGQSYPSASDIVYIFSTQPIFIYIYIYIYILAPKL